MAQPKFVDYTFSKGKQVSLTHQKLDFYPHLLNLESPTPDGKIENEILNQLKAQITASGTVNYKNDASTSTAPPPLVGMQFYGNGYDGIPTDNNIAISNDGHIVSVSNSTVYTFQYPDDTLIRSISLEAFTDTSLPDLNKFDPKILYDPKLNKFIMVYLNANRSTQNHIILAFSETSNPNGNWFQYALPGNPKSNNTWSDYPIIAITDEELFVTVNLIKDDSSWQAGFSESIIWQIKKSNGYAGDSLETKLWSNILFNGTNVRNLCPLQGGSTTYGPEIYFVSNRNFSLENDSAFILKISGRIQDSPNLTVKFIKLNNTYGLPPNATQRTNLYLQTNDARFLAGYFENNKIHAVGNTKYSPSGKAGIFHVIIENPETATTGKLTALGDTLFDFGYPNIAYTGRYTGDEQSIIGFNHSALDSFPGTSAIFYEKWAGYSSRLQLIKGESFVNLITGNLERWGDYSGAQRKYNQPGNVWLSGFLGRRLTGGGPGITYANTTWISEVTSPYSIGASIENRNLSKTLNIYPNPANERTNILFEVENTSLIKIIITEVSNGKSINVFSDIMDPGKKNFSFSTATLSSGTYIVSVQSEQGNLLYTRKLSITH